MIEDTGKESLQKTKNVRVWREPIVFSLERAIEYLRAVLLDKFNRIINELNKEQLEKE